MRRVAIALAVLLATPRLGAMAPINNCEVRGEITFVFFTDPGCDPDCVTHTVAIDNDAATGPGLGVNDLFIECIDSPDRFGVDHCQQVGVGDCVHATGRLVCDAGFCRCAALTLFTEIPATYCPP